MKPFYVSKTGAEYLIDINHARAAYTWFSDNPAGGRLGDFTDGTWVYFIDAEITVRWMARVGLLQVTPTKTAKGGTAKVYTLTSGTTWSTVEDHWNRPSKVLGEVDGVTIESDYYAYFMRCVYAQDSIITKNAKRFDAYLKFAKENGAMWDEFYASFPSEDSRPLQQ